MSDLISRHDAIEMLKECEVVESDNFTRTDPVSMMVVATIADCIKAIVELPSAESERKKGEWISHENYDECSKCHCFTSVGFNYCPHCGAEMKRGE